jgi:hypothetical protein
MYVSVVNGLASRVPAICTDVEAANGSIFLDYLGS